MGWVANDGQEVPKPLPLPRRPCGLCLRPRSPGPPVPPAPAPAPTVLELPWLSLSKRNFRFDLGEFLFFRSAGRSGKAKKKNNNL